MLWCVSSFADFSGAPGASAVDRGEYLARAGGCPTCHTDKKNGGAPLAGGRAIASPYGTLFTPNITPDRETGIGAWPDEDFIRAMRLGKGPHGRTYYPAFPYQAYTKLREKDLLDLRAYLASVEPVHAPNRPHELRFPFSWRALLYPWRWLYFSPSRFEADDALSAEENRGAYLVEALGHCAECHTPRNMLAAPKSALAFAGTRYGPDGSLVPNITPDEETGIGDWSIGDLVFFFRTGLKPDGDDVQGEMRESIADGLSHLSDEDLHALAAYLKRLKPINRPVRHRKKARTQGVSYDDW